MSTKVERVKDLIKLATDDGAALEEARSAAHAACKIIKTEKLEVVESNQAIPRVSLDEAWDSIYSALRNRPSVPPDTVFRMKSPWVIVCWQCKGTIRFGEEIARKPEKAWCHADCVDR